MQYKFFYWGPFVMQSIVEQEFVDILLEKGLKSRKKKELLATKNLAGVLDNEYYYEDFESWFVPLLYPYLTCYLESYHTKFNPHREQTQILVKEWSIKKLWINYQQAKDYNPPHTHNEDLSFIIYLQVPSKLKKEYVRRKGEHNDFEPGVINFNYGNNLPFSINNYSRLPEEGNIFIFPAWLIHYVHAFKSDVERISVSGNIIINYVENEEVQSKMKRYNKV